MPRREGEDRVDPVARTRQHLEARGLWDGARELRLATEVRADVERALAEAAAADKPARATMFDDVYAELPWHLRDERDCGAAIDDAECNREGTKSLEVWAGSSLPGPAWNRKGPKALEVRAGSGLPGPA